MSSFKFKSLLTPGERVTEEQFTQEERIVAFGRSLQQVSRRRFFSTLAVAGAAAGTLGATGALTGCTNNGPIQSTPGTNPGTGAPSVTAVLNFALNLEYFEANFYSAVSTGSPIPASYQGGSGAGTVTGAAAVKFAIPEVQTAAAQLAANELAHVQLLQSTITSLGATPVPMPSINLAAGTGAPTTDAQFLALARLFEGVGVSAYAGGAQYLISSAAVLTAASQILHLEAQHEGFLRLLCIANNVISPAADALDTPPLVAATAAAPNPAPVPFNTSATTGYVPFRDTSQVLQIVYGSPGQIGVSKGGYFPNGLNGTITTT